MFRQLSLGVEQEGDRLEAGFLPVLVEASHLDRISIEAVVDPGEDLGGEEEGVSHHLLPLGINAAVVHPLEL